MVGHSLLEINYRSHVSFISFRPEVPRIDEGLESFVFMPDTCCHICLSR